MVRYTLKKSVVAAQFDGADSIPVVAEIVRRHRDGPSYDTMQGSLSFYNGGPNVVVNRGDWVVDLEGELVVLSDHVFRTLFAKDTE